MGLTNSQSFATGSSGGSSTVVFEKPATGQGIVASSSSSNGTTFYTVPAGYYFKGYLIHDNMQYSPEVSNSSIPKAFMAMSRDHGESNARGNSQSNDIVLPPGATVKVGYSMSVWVFGNLYSI